MEKTRKKTKNKKQKKKIQEKNVLKERKQITEERLKDFHWLYERNKKCEIEEKRRRKKKKRKLHTDNDQPSSH